MSTNAPRRPRVQKGKRTFQIVASQFNEQYVQGLVAHAAEELRELASGAAISIHRVPGSFEIPVVVRELARKKKSGCDYRLWRNHAWRNRPREKSQPFCDRCASTHCGRLWCSSDQCGAQFR
jgi:6,7-dimethyl-8-ribityllumazine synthase